LNKLQENEQNNKNEIRIKMNELNTIREHKFEGLKIRSKARWVDKGEKTY
jgi:hypothetical protein